MKVYVKKEDKNSIIPGIIITIVFIIFSLYAIMSFFETKKDSSIGVLLFGIIFFGLSMYLIYGLFKRPKCYKAKLVDKKVETYKGRQITYMEFNIETEDENKFISSNYYCYTIGVNSLIVGNDYSLKIKEFNWNPIFVDEINNSYVEHKNKIASKLPRLNMSPVFYAVGLFFGGIAFACILGIIMYPQYIISYIIYGTFHGLALFMIIKVGKQWNEDNDNNEKIEKDLKLKLEKIKPIYNNQEKVGNIEIKYSFIMLFVFPIIWFVIFLIANAPKDLLIKGPLLLSLVVEIPMIVKLLYSIGSDERLIKKHKVNISRNINVDKIKHFNIFRATRDAYPQYFIVDQNKNLIFKIKRNNFSGTKLVICNYNNIKVGEIKTKFFSVTDEFVINIINERPFIVRSKMQLNANYQVIGRDYYVKGNTELTKNVICDNKENDIAYISAVSKRNNNWYGLGNTEVVLNDNVNNSVDIIITALCVTIGNFDRPK